VPTEVVSPLPVPALLEEEMVPRPREITVEIEGNLGIK
jgi:hypothetical protein